MTKQSKTAILIAEKQADHRPWLDFFGRDAEHVEVIVQGATEEPATFASRARRMTAALAEQSDLVQAALVSNEGTSQAQLAARAEILRCIVFGLGPGKQARVFLDAGSRPGPHQIAMQAIASSLDDVAANNVDIIATTGPDAGRIEVA